MQIWQRIQIVKNSWKRRHKAFEDQGPRGGGHWNRNRINHARETVKCKSRDDTNVSQSVWDHTDFFVSRNHERCRDISQPSRDGSRFFDADSRDVNDRCQMYQNFRQMVQQSTGVNDLDETTISRDTSYVRVRCESATQTNTKWTCPNYTP